MTTTTEIVEQPDEPLTKEEARTLLKLEDTIRRNLLTYVKVGMALKEIRELRLYRISHKNFESYCREKWDFGRDNADRLIAASVVVENLPTIGGITPTSESVVRPLTQLPPELQSEAWEAAVEAAPGAPTARDVRAAVKTVVETHAPPAKKSNGKAKKALERIHKVCGIKIMEAIADESLQLSDADIIAWAAENDTTMVHMQELIVGQRWKPAKAKKFLSNMPDGKTSIEELQNYALANEGKFEYQESGFTTVTVTADYEIVVKKKTRR